MYWILDINIKALNSFHILVWIVYDDFKFKYTSEIIFLFIDWSNKYYISAYLE